MGVYFTEIVYITGMQQQLEPTIERSTAYLVQGSPSTGATTSRHLFSHLYLDQNQWAGCLNGIRGDEGLGTRGMLDMTQSWSDSVSVRHAYSRLSFRRFLFTSCRLYRRSPIWMYWRTCRTGPRSWCSLGIPRVVSCC